MKTTPGTITCQSSDNAAHKTKDMRWYFSSKNSGDVHEVIS